ncbi:MAG: PAS domain-containing protein [Rubrivivax sp.]|nr:PAS domain-containing protein [Rubrivivax sp.]
MKKNLPVTQHEHDFPGDVTLMSATDVKGRILYANDAFIAVSGFEREKLMRKAHNVVRHPDVPPQVFEDLWKTLQAGLTWSAVVKNRRQDGDHYWVRANSTPVQRNGRLVGYMSVRTKPTRAEIDAAEALFKNMREGRAKGIRVHRGLVMRTGVLGLASRTLQTLPVRWRLRLGVWPIAALAPFGAWWAGVAGAELATLAAAGAATVLACAAWLERQITRPLDLLQRQALAVAAGGLAEGVRLNRVDEVGMIQRAIEQAGLNLRSVLDDVSSQIDGLKTASSEIEQGTLDLSSRTEQTAANLQQTASSMEELTSTVRNNADGAQSAAKLADVASQAAGRGGEVMGEVVSEMGAIASASQRIGDIIGVIDGIAFQTNILALNAAVEAARAGEQGRGFAVVAGEVRSLAHRSAEAAKEIKTLVGDSIEKVGAGSRLVSGAGEAMSDIVAQVRRVGELVETINRATSEQAAGIDMVNQAVLQLDRSTQQNAALVEQESAAAGNLRAQAQRLHETVGIYRDGIAAAAEA